MNYTILSSQKYVNVLLKVSQVLLLLLSLMDSPFIECECSHFAQITSAKRPEPGTESRSHDVKPHHLSTELIVQR